MLAAGNLSDCSEIVDEGSVVALQGSHYHRANGGRALGHALARETVRR
jgi:hypothetical protein